MKRLLISLLLLVSAFSAVTEGHPQSRLDILPAPRINAFYMSAAAPFAKANFYAAGTTTRQATYSNADGAVGHLNANPVVADANGLFPAIYLLPVPYKIVLTTSANVTIYTQDDIQGRSSVGISFLTPQGTAAQNTTLLQAALDAGDTIYISGSWNLNTITIPSNSQIFGSGQGKTILKAADNALLSYLLHVPAGSTGSIIRNVTLDGNRANAGLINAFSAPLYIEGSRNSLVDSEVKNGTFAGIWIGTALTSVQTTLIDSDYIHDNGGVTNNAGNGVGIFGGGTISPADIKITNSRIERNYNTVTKPNDSSGINITGTRIIISNNTFEDNFNVAGGQIVLWGSPDQDADIQATVTGNTMTMTTTFGTPTDRTGGVEIQGRKFSVVGNFVKSLSTTAWGVGIGGTLAHGSGDGVIVGNTFDVLGAGIQFDTAGLNSPQSNVVVSGNKVLNGAAGVATTSFITSINIADNDFTGCTQAQSGTLSDTISMQNNLPFTVTNGAVGRTHTPGAAVTAANNLTLGNSNSNEVSGTTTINLISSVGWVAGDVVRLYFTASVTVKSGIANSGNFKTLHLAGGADFSATADDVLYLLWNGTLWEQVSASNNA